MMKTFYKFSNKKYKNSNKISKIIMIKKIKRKIRYYDLYSIFLF